MCLWALKLSWSRRHLIRKCVVPRNSYCLPHLHFMKFTCAEAWVKSVEYDFRLDVEFPDHANHVLRDACLQ